MESWNTNPAYDVLMISEVGFAGFAAVDLVAVEVGVVCQPHGSRHDTSRALGWMREGRRRSAVVVERRTTPQV